MFLGRQIKAQHFFTYSTSKVDVEGLSATLKGKIPEGESRFSFGHIYINPERQDVTEKLQNLDLLQWSLTNDVNALSDDNIRDQKLREIIDVKVQMWRLIAGLREGDIQPDALTQAEQD